jgi:hypothetical protein
MQVESPTESEKQKRVCAFCPHLAKLSAEHVLGKWMNKLFVGKMKGKYLDGLGRQSERTSKEIDGTAKAVCEQCNNTWMSDIETMHGEPALTPLIKGEEELSIGTAEATSLAIWTFKTAVVLGHANKRSSSLW